eukprot:CAMPEP_0170100816 /NCGR_PEP_ID=MMETSP0020_2-20130122/1879_1 /TAXON_ID=98059 /ORGANISM="Dinobryon sp., Strain UTEXLB2267" /LENGTH=2204 /DNA_ID=CAMNT_0010323775 /DNA_START=142 /DNA_END=6754 /DNA_ORIENTATION=-
MPYERSKTLNGPIKGATLFQKMRVNDITLRKTEELKRNRDEFIRQIKREKFEKDRLKFRAATKIQAAFRGFRARPKKPNSFRKQKAIVVLSQSELYDELCVMAAKLDLSPIPGLNLEARSRASKRKRRIETVAIFRIQNFFKMLVAKKKAKATLRLKSIENVEKAARKLTKFFRYIKTKNFVNRCEEIKKSRLILKLQCSERVHQSHARVRLMRQKKHENYRKNEAAVIIQRNFAPKYRSMNMARVVSVTFRAIAVMAGHVVEDLSEKLAEEMLEHAIKFPAHERLNEEWPVYLKSIEKAKDLCVESELKFLLEVAAQEWIEDQIKAIAKEKERLAELQELFLMSEQDDIYAIKVVEVIEEPPLAEIPVEDVVVQEEKEELSDPQNLAAVEEVGDTFDEEQQPGSALSARTPRTVRSTLPSPGRQNTLVEEEEAIQSRRSSFMSIVSFPDDSSQPEFSLANSVANFVSKIASKIMQRTVLTEAHLAESDRRSTQSMEEDDKSTARSLVSFQGDESNSAYSFRGSVRDFVSKISDKVITKVMSPDAGNNSLRNNSFHDEDKEIEMHETADDSLLREESTSGPSIDPALQLTSSISDFVVAITEQSLIEPSADLLADSIVHGDAVVPIDTGRSSQRSRDTKSFSESEHTGPMSSRSLISKPEGTHSASVELQESVSDDTMPVEVVDMSMSQESIIRLYTKDIKVIRLSESQKDKIEFSIEASLRFFAYAEYQQSVQCLDLASTILSSIPADDHTHNEYVALRALITLIKANNFFVVAAYEEAKLLYESVLTSRLSVFGIGHMLVAEAQYHCAEWHRSQANYKLAEDFYSSAITQLEMIVSRASEEESEEHFPITLLARALIGFTELLRHSGQYFRANETLKRAQTCVRTIKNNGVLSFELQGEFICCLVSLFLLKGKISNGLILHQELFEKRRVYFTTINEMSRSIDSKGEMNMEENGPIQHPKLASSMYSLGLLLLGKCEYVDACKYIEDSLSMRRQVYPADHPAIAASLYLKACAFIAFGKFQDAAIEMANSLEIRLKKLGSEHPSVAQSLTGIANIQTLLGYPNDALPNYFKGLAIYKERYGHEMHRDIVESIFRLGLNAESRGVYVEATRYLENALRLQESLVPLYDADIQSHGGHLTLEWIKVNLAHLYTKLSRVEEAKAIMKTSVKAISKVLGQGNSMVAQSLCFLGELCRIRGNYFDAKTLFSLSFSTANQLYGDNHPDVSRVLSESGENFRISGFFNEALELSSTALDISVILFGRDNLTVAHSLFRKAQILRDSVQFEEAEQLYSETLTIVSSKLNEDNGLFGMVLADLGECFRLMKRKSQAEEKFRLAINILKNSHGEGSLIVAETLCNYSNLLVDIRNPSAAVQLLTEKVLPVFDSLLGKAHPWTMYCRANLAVAILLNSLNQSIISQIQQYQTIKETDLSSAINSVKSGIAGHPDIVDFLNYCRQSSFSTLHPWVLRFSGETDGDLASHLSTDYVEDASYGSGSLGYYSSYTPQSLSYDVNSFVSASLTASGHDSSGSSIYDDDSISLDATVSPRSLTSSILYRREDTASLRSDLSQISHSNAALSPENTARTKLTNEDENSNFTLTPRSIENDERRQSIVSRTPTELNSFMSPADKSVQSSGESFSAESMSKSFSPETTVGSPTESGSASITIEKRRTHFGREDSQQSGLSGDYSSSYNSQFHAHPQYSRGDSQSDSVMDSVSGSSSRYTENTPYTYKDSSQGKSRTLDSTSERSYSDLQGDSASLTRSDFQSSSVYVDGIAAMRHESSDGSKDGNVTAQNSASFHSLLSNRSPMRDSKTQISGSPPLSVSVANGSKTPSHASASAHQPSATSISKSVDAPHRSVPMGQSASSVEKTTVATHSPPGSGGFATESRSDSGTYRHDGSYSDTRTGSDSYYPESSGIKYSESLVTDSRTPSTDDYTKSRSVISPSSSVSPTYQTPQLSTVEESPKTSNHRSSKPGFEAAANLGDSMGSARSGNYSNAKDSLEVSTRTASTAVPERSMEVLVEPHLQEHSAATPHMSGANSIAASMEKASHSKSPVDNSRSLASGTLPQSSSVLHSSTYGDSHQKGSYTTDASETNSAYTPFSHGADSDGDSYTKISDKDDDASLRSRQSLRNKSSYTTGTGPQDSLEEGPTRSSIAHNSSSTSYDSKVSNSHDHKSSVSHSSGTHGKDYEENSYEDEFESVEDDIN